MQHRGGSEIPRREAQMRHNRPVGATSAVSRRSSGLPSCKALDGRTRAARALSAFGQRKDNVPRPEPKTPNLLDQLAAAGLLVRYPIRDRDGYEVAACYDVTAAGLRALVGATASGTPPGQRTMPHATSDGGIGDRIATGERPRN